MPTEDLGDPFLLILYLLKILVTHSCWFYALCLPIHKLFILVSFQFPKIIVPVMFQKGSFLLCSKKDRSCYVPKRIVLVSLQFPKCIAELFLLGSKKLRSKIDCSFLASLWSGLEKVLISPWLVTLLHICGVTPQSPISLVTPHNRRRLRIERRHLRIERRRLHIERQVFWVFHDDHNVFWCFTSGSQCFTRVSWCFTVFNVLWCLASRATIGGATATATADRLRDLDNVTGIGDNAAGIGDNSAEIGDDAAGIVNIAA